MLVFMFPGQGSQVRGMGRELFDSVREYAEAEAQIDALMGYSVRQLCLEDPKNQLKETQFTQPCLYLVNALHYYKARADGLQPQVLIGHSLGEYNALLAAGAFDLLTGLRLVKKRGELMAQARNGSMLAVVGLAPERIGVVLSEQGLKGVDVANFNSPTQTVISGLGDELKRATAPLEAAGARCVPLPVSAAFHSRYMTPAAHAFDDFLADFDFEALQIPVIANVTGRPYPTSHPSHTVRSMLVRQMAQSVLWSQSIRGLLESGATEFTELGPGQVLTRLVQQIR